ncbi:MAG: FAD-binding oxidoreductase [Chloroflexota bacterium]
MRSFDAVVIGGGVIGCSIAMHLAERGVKRVALLERSSLCAGNTRKSGGLIRMHYSNEPETRLALASLPYFQDWQERIGGDCGFVQTGFAMIVGPNNAERLRRRIARLRSWGVDTTAVDPAELSQLQPGVDLAGIAAAAYEPGSGYADPLATTLALADRARGLGVAVLEETPVLSIETAGDRVSGVRTVDESIAADIVVCAANTWSGSLLAPLGIALPIHARRAQVAFYQRPAALTRQLVLIDLVIGTYTRPEGATETLGGISAEAHVAPCDPDAHREEMDEGFAQATRARLAMRLPAIGRAAISRGQAGMYDMSPDTRAVIDRVQAVPGLYVAAGFSGTGFKKAPAVGARLAELITCGTATTADLDPFRLDRFALGERFASEDEYVLPGDWGHAF